MPRPTAHTNDTLALRDVTVRLADRADSQALQRLAELDSASAPVGPMVVADIDGEIVAAVPVAGGPALADPFRRTAALVEMLVLRAAQLRPEAPVARARAAGARIAGLVRHARRLGVAPSR